MNLLETLVAFVSTALAARPDPVREALADGTRLLMETQAALVVARFERDCVRAELAARVLEVDEARDENARLRYERDQQNNAAQAQQQNPAAIASLVLLNGLARSCTCVPGRYDALRHPRAGELNGA